MMSDQKQKSTVLQSIAFGAAILAIILATYALLGVLILNNHYNPLTAENWYIYALPIAMWSAFCGGLVWLMKRLRRRAFEGKGWIIGACFAGFVIIASLLIFVE